MTKRERRLLVFLGNICILGLLIFMITDIVTRISSISRDIDLLNEKIKERNFDIASFRKVMAEIEKYSIINAESTKIIVPMTNNENLHIYLENLLKQSELSTLNVDINERVYIEDSSATVDLVANVYGDYNNFYDFLLSLEEQNKLIDVEALDIYTDFTDRYNLSFTLRFFMSEDSYDSNFDFDAGVGQGSNRLAIWRVYSE